MLPRSAASLQLELSQVSVEGSMPYEGVSAVGAPALHKLVWNSNGCGADVMTVNLHFSMRIYTNANLQLGVQIQWVCNVALIGANLHRYQIVNLQP